MQVWASSLSIYLVAWLALAFVGYGMTALTIPAQLRRYQPLLAPFIGYAIISILFHLLNTTFLAGRECTWVVFGLAAAVNLYVGVRLRGGLVLTEWREILAVSLLSLAIYLVAVSPILDYGYPTVVGANGDVEYYLSRAEYARSWAIPDIGSAYSNPFRNTALAQGIRGFVYLLYVVSTLVQQPLHSAFAPLLGFLVSAGSVGMYIFARTTLGLRWRASVVAALVLGLNALILWSALFNYARQVASLALLPVAAAAIATWYEHPNRRSTVFLGLLLCAVLLTYPLTAMACLASVAALVAFAVFRRTKPSETLGLTAMLMALCLLFAFPGFRSSLQAIATRYTTITSPATIWSDPLPDTFLSIGHLYGFDYYVWPRVEPLQQSLGNVGSSLIGACRWPATAIAICLGIYALSRASQPRRLVLACLLLGHLVFLFTAPFIATHYIYFKALTLCAFLATGLAVLGLAYAWRWTEGKARTLRLSTQAGLSLFGIVTLALVACNAYLVTTHFFSEPRSAFSNRALEAEALKAVIPAGASLYVSDDYKLEGPPMGVLSYVLMQNPLYGQIQTVASSLRASCPHQPSHGNIVPYDSEDGAALVNLCDYALLAAHEDPADRGYGGSKAVWSNRDIKVYKRGTTLARLDFSSTGGYRPVAKARPLEFTVVESPTETDERVPTPGQDNASRCQLAFQVASFGSQQFSLTIDGEEQLIHLPAGLSVYRTEPLEMPVAVSLSSTGDDPAYITWVDVREPQTGSCSLSNRDDIVLLQVQHEHADSRVKTKVGYLNTEAMHKPLWLELHEEIAGLPGDYGRLIHRWLLDSEAGEMQFEVNLDGLMLELVPLDFGQPGIPKRLALGEGEHVLGLWLSQEEGGGEVSSTRVTDLFKLNIQEGAVAQFDEISVPLAYAPVSTAERVDATVGDVARLVGYALEPSSMWPGGLLKVALYWKPLTQSDRAYAAFVHLLDSEGHMWGQEDRGLESGARSPEHGDLVVQTHEISIAERTPPGKYSVAVGMYRRSDLERLPVSAAGSQLSDFVILDWVKVGRKEPLSAENVKIENPHRVNFEKGISLLGYDVRTGGDFHNDTLRVKLYWQAQDWVEKDYTVFVHLVDEEHTVAAQDDAQPVRNHYPTSIWAPNEMVIDEHSMALDSLPPGEYRIEIGLYIPSTGERVKIVSEKAAKPDHVLLFTITVGEESTPALK